MSIMNNNDVMKIEIFLELFFQRASRLVKVMVKLWGGVSSILIEGIRPTFIQLLIFYWIYQFYWFFIDFIDFIDFLSILSILLIFIDFIDFIDFSPILLIFHQFHPFLLVFWLVLPIFMNFSTSFYWVMNF